MKKKIISFLIVSSLIFIFIIFYKGLNRSNFYQPKSEIKDLPQFSAISFYSKKKIESKNIFNVEKYYILNIWASWCLPCRDEHPILFDLAKIEKLKIIGLNYKDKESNAKNFLDELGDPYEKILLDYDGTSAIELGAIGVPETFLIYKNKIIKKFIGPLNHKSIEEIEKIIK
jgi:cytochrome c biogenesis protein CcmG/thiol:disulfide interchange protein DsbE